jgi:hypothetical protein
MKEYTDEQIEEMREKLWLDEYNTLDAKNFREILWSGCSGFEHLSKAKIIELYEESES